MDKLNLTATINLQRPDKNGKCAIRISWTIKRKVSYYPTGVSVLENQFSAGHVIQHPNKDYLNTVIRQKIAEIERLTIDGKVLNLKPVNELNFYLYCEGKIKQEKSRVSHGTWKHKKSYLNKLKDFKPTIKISDLSPSFMLEYENYCRRQGNKPTTVWSSIKFVKATVNAALNEGLITGNPLKGYKAQPYGRVAKGSFTPRPSQHWT